MSLSKICCPLVNHNKNPIYAVCLRGKCNSQPSICDRCTKFIHSDHLNELKQLTEIDKIIDTCFQIPAIKQSLEKLNDVVRSTLKDIEKSQSNAQHLKILENPLQNIHDLQALASLYKSSRNLKQHFSQKYSHIYQELDSLLKLLSKESVDQVIVQKPTPVNRQSISLNKSKLTFKGLQFNCQKHDSPILGLCMNKECAGETLYCIKCTQDHTGHVNDVAYFDQLEEALKDQLNVNQIKEEIEFYRDGTQKKLNQIHIQIANAEKHIQAFKDKKITSLGALNQLALVLKLVFNWEGQQLQDLIRVASEKIDYEEGTRRKKQQQELVKQQQLAKEEEQQRKTEQERLKKEKEEQERRKKQEEKLKLQKEKEEQEKEQIRQAQQKKKEQVREKKKGIEEQNPTKQQGQNEWQKQQELLKQEQPVQQQQQRPQESQQQQQEQKQKQQQQQQLQQQQLQQQEQDQQLQGTQSQANESQLDASQTISDARSPRSEPLVVIKKNPAEHTRKIKRQQTIQAYLRQAEELEESGQLDEALKSINSVLEIDPNNYEALYNKGIVLDCLERYKESIECYNRCHEQKPYAYLLWNNKGSAYESLGNSDEAIKCFQEAVRLNPKYAKGFYNLGYQHHKLDRFEEAVEYYDKALAIDPVYVAALNNKGSAYDNLGLFNKAIECYDKLLEIDNQNYIVITNKGLALESLGQYQQALIQYQKALKLQPKYKVCKTYMDELQAKMAKGK